MKENVKVISFETAKAISSFLSTVRENQFMPNYDWAYDYDVDTDEYELNFYGGRLKNEGYNAYYISDIIDWMRDTLSIHMYVSYDINNNDGFLTYNIQTMHIIPFANIPLYKKLREENILQYDFNLCQDSYYEYDMAIRRIIIAYTEVLEKEYDEYDNEIEEYEKLIARIRENKE